MGSSLFADPSLDALEKRRGLLDREVEAYSARVVEHHKGSEQEVQQIIALLQEATGGFTD